MSENKKTCLYDKHVALGAQMAPFAGFDMPIQYSGIIPEHNAVRNACGVFDVSHMGEVVITGAQAEEFVQYIFTNDVEAAPYGKIFYGMMLYPNGGVVDDLLVYVESPTSYLLVINASNIEKDVEWIESLAKDYDVQVTNRSDYYGQLAVQGPLSEAIVQKYLGVDCSDLAFYTFKEIAVDGEQVIVSRTGYTGEDGFEFYGSHAFINKAWDQLLASGEVTPCGLGSRDTLRFEVGLPLYGNEFSSEVTPIEAGLGMFVKVHKPKFVGREAIVKQKADGIKRKVVGILLESRAVPRHGYEVEADAKKIGVVTTGYNSISTGQSVCLALIDKAYSEQGTAVEVRIHKRLHKGVVTKKTFYKKSYKK